MRARMALAYANIDYQVREVVLRDKPPSMLELSSKGTVPVLCLGERLQGESILDESIDIFDWALGKHDPDGWCDYDAATLAEMKALTLRCDMDFKSCLDYYKYADRHPQRSQLDYRQEAGVFLGELEHLLAAQPAEPRFLFGPRMSYADVAIFPFIRQFAHVDLPWFETAAYPHLQTWLTEFKNSALFLSIMKKYPQWQEGDAVTLFSES